MAATLRPQQQHLIDQIDQAIEAGCRRIMVQAPTGFGKTIVAGAIAGKTGMPASA
jgi:superfamily II DNA or RNA helicase